MLPSRTLRVDGWYKFVILDLVLMQFGFLFERNASKALWFIALQKIHLNFKFSKYVGNFEQGKMLSNPHAITEVQVPAKHAP